MMFGLPPNVPPPGNNDGCIRDLALYLGFVFFGFFLLAIGAWFLALPVFVVGLWFLFRNWSEDDDGDDWPGGMA